jgi:hypothetical protein
MGKYVLDPLIARETAIAFQTLASSADNITVLALSGVNDLVFKIVAKWTAHRLYPFL